MAEHRLARVAATAATALRAHHRMRSRAVPAVTAAPTAASAAAAGASSPASSRPFPAAATAIRFDGSVRPVRVAESRAECQSQAGRAASSSAHRLLTGWWQRSLLSRAGVEPHLLLSYWTDVGVSRRVLEKLLHEMRVAAWADGSFDHPVGRFWPAAGERSCQQGEQATASVRATASASDTSRLPLPPLLLRPLSVGRRRFLLQQRDDFFLLTHRQHRQRQDRESSNTTLLLRLTWHAVRQQEAGEEREDTQAEELSRSVRCNVRVQQFDSASCPPSLQLLPEARSMKELQERILMRVEQFADRLFHSRFPLLDAGGARLQQAASERRVYDRRPGCWSQVGRLRPSGSSSPSPSSFPSLQRDCWTLRTDAGSGRLLSFDTDVGVSEQLMVALLHETAADGFEQPQPAVLGAFLQPAGARRWRRRGGRREMRLTCSALPAAIRDCIHRAQSRHFLLSGRAFRLCPAAPLLCISYQRSAAIPQRLTWHWRWHVRPAVDAGEEADVTQQGQHREEEDGGDGEAEQAAAAPSAPRLAVSVRLQLDVFDHRLVPGSRAEARDMRSLQSRISSRLQRWADGLMHDKHSMLTGVRMTAT